MNIVPWRFKGQKPLGTAAPRVLALELLRDNIHQDTPSAFPHIVSLCTAAPPGEFKCGVEKKPRIVDGEPVEVSHT